MQQKNPFKLNGDKLRKQTIFFPEVRAKNKEYNLLRTIIAFYSKISITINSIVRAWYNVLITVMASSFILFRARK